MTDSGMLYRLDISTFYFYEALLFQIFFPWKFIYKNLGTPLSSINFTANSHADNHFYKYVYLFQNIIQYEVKVFYIQI